MARPVISRVGQVFYDIEVIEELGAGKARGKCKICGTEGIYEKTNLRFGKVSCKNPECPNSFNNKHRTYKNYMLGKIINGTQVIEELGNNMIRVKCLSCGEEAEYEKSRFMYSSNDKGCKNINCVNCRRANMDMIGKTRCDFTLLRVSKSMKYVIVRCERCGEEFETRKNTFSYGTVLCQNCGITAKNFNRINTHNICDVTVDKFEYVGRDGQPYYTCRCNSCGDALLLGYDKIFSYKCDKNKPCF